MLARIVGLGEDWIGERRVCWRVKEGIEFPPLMRWRGGSCGREGNWPAEGAGFGREVRGRETPDSAVGWTWAPLTECAEVGRDGEGIGSLVLALDCCKKSF